MKLKVILIWCIFFFEGDSQTLYLFNNDENLYGFMDSVGAVVVQPQFKAASDMTCNLYPVEIDERWGAINSTGDIVIEPKFQSGFSFDNNCQFAAVKQNWKYGFIDTLGNVAIDFKYEIAYNFDESGLSGVLQRNNKWIFINKKGEQSFDGEYQEIHTFGTINIASIKVDGKWGFINKNGEVVVQPNYDLTWGFYPEQNIAAVKIKRRIGILTESKWGFIDKEGNVKIDFLYDEVGSFFRGDRIQASIGDDYFYINQKGKKKIKGPFSGAREFGDHWEGKRTDLAVISINDKYGLIDTKGKVVLEPKFGYLSLCDDDILIFSAGGKQGLLGIDGSIIIEPIFDFIHCFDENGIAPVWFSMDEDAQRREGAVSINGDFIGFTRDEID